MQIDAVVINASPLITLFRSGQADLLPRLFKRIVVPHAVWQEVVQDGWEDAPALELRQQSWPVLEPVEISPRVAAWSLGAGETEVLSYALAHPPLRAVIDDMDARRCAQTLGIPIFGTGGLQVLAKRRGLLRSVGEAITKLRGAGLWLSEELVQILPIRFVAKVIENAKSPHQFSSTRSENATHAAGRIHSPGNSFDVFGNKPDRHGTNLAGASG